MNVFAHGEDKLGPNGGYIRMPGAFHTEVVQEKNSYKVYLLDINWQNPSTLDSSVSATIVNGKKKTELSCSKSDQFYTCSSEEPQKGELQIKAKREGQLGNIAIYKLPLKLETQHDKKAEHKMKDHHQGH